MHDARAISNFFLDRAASREAPLTHMTLLKVLYFAHAWYLAKNGVPLVAQPFEAWEHGPVVRVVYDQFKASRDKPIQIRAVSLDPQTATFKATPYKFDPDTEKFLGDIFDYYSRFHPFKLSHLTHEKGGPWHVVWTEAERRAVPGMIISNELISSWFKGRDALFWTNQERSRLV